jgi:hypothetical protein
MDGTIADYVGQIDRDLERLRSPLEEVAKMSHGIKFPDHIWNRIELIKNSKDWWVNLPRMEDGFEIMRVAQEIGFEIHVLTKGPSNTKVAWTQKVEWCSKHLPKGTNVTITQDKSLIYGRILVDDYPAYMDSWLANRPRALGVMPLREYNADYKHPNVIHYDGTKESLEIVRQKMQEQFIR